MPGYGAGGQYSTPGQMVAGSQYAQPAAQTSGQGLKILIVILILVSWFPAIVGCLLSMNVMGPAYYAVIFFLIATFADKAVILTGVFGSNRKCLVVGFTVLLLLVEALTFLVIWDLLHILDVFENYERHLGSDVKAWLGWSSLLLLLFMDALLAFLVGLLTFKSSAARVSNPNQQSSPDSTA